MASSRSLPACDPQPATEREREPSPGSMAEAELRPAWVQVQRPSYAACPRHEVLLAIPQSDSERGPQPGPVSTVARSAPAVAVASVSLFVPAQVPALAPPRAPLRALVLASSLQQATATEPPAPPPETKRLALAIARRIPPPPRSGALRSLHPPRPTAAARRAHASSRPASAPVRAASAPLPVASAPLRVAFAPVRVARAMAPSFPTAA